MSPQPIYITRPLLSVLLEIAADAEPNPATVSLVVSAAGDLEPLPEDARPESRENPQTDTTSAQALADVDPETPVFSDFYFPDAGNALDFVFGVDLATPVGQSQGRFLSHPDGNPELTVRDDLHATVVVAIPPWKPANVSVYDRDSTRRDLAVLAAGTPERDFEE